MDRRQFLQSTAVTAGVLAASSSSWTRAVAAEPSKTPKGFKKAVKIGMVQVDGSLLDKFKLLRELGFDGVELDAPGGATAEQVNQAKAETGLEVPGVVDSVHWRDCLSDPSEEVRAKGLAALQEALRECKKFGGTSVLLVPGKVTKDVTYQQCWDRSVAEIKKAVPLAEELGIDILIENVWNDFLTEPKQMADFIDQCGSSRVGAHFDVGNTVRYSPPHEWIPILGKRIKKLDIKDYKRSEKNPYEGFAAKLLEGDVDWPKVMDELEKIGYVGWGTAEIQRGGREWLTDVAARMNKIFAS